MVNSHFLQGVFFLEISFVNVGRQQPKKNEALIARLKYKSCVQFA